MRENMPGKGYAQGHVDLVDRGPRTTSTFDSTYLTPQLAKQLELRAMELGIRGEDGTFKPYPAYIRDRGAWSEEGQEKGPDYNEAVLRAIYAARPTSMKPRRPEDAEAPPMLPSGEVDYLDALYDFFKDRIALWPGTPMGKEYLLMVMHETRSTRDIGDDMGVSHEAVVQGRKRAVTSFVQHMGGKATLAEKLRQYLFDRELQDGRDRLKYLPRWIHG